MSDELYLQKYLKYKNKYLELQKIAQDRMRNQRGGDPDDQTEYILVTGQVTLKMVEKLVKLVGFRDNVRIIWASPTFNHKLISGDLEESDVIDKMIDNKLIPFNKNDKINKKEEIKNAVLEVRNRIKQQLIQLRKKILFLDIPLFGFNLYQMVKSSFGMPTCNIDLFGINKIFEHYFIGKSTIEQLEGLINDLSIKERTPAKRKANEKALNTVDMLRTNFFTFYLVVKYNKLHPEKVTCNQNIKNKVLTILKFLFQTKKNMLMDIGISSERNIEELFDEYFVDDTKTLDTCNNLDLKKIRHLVRLMNEILSNVDTELSNIIDAKIPDNDNEKLNFFFSQFKKLIIRHEKNKNQSLNLFDLEYQSGLDIINDVLEKEYAIALLNSDSENLKHHYTFYPEQRTLEQIGKLYASIKRDGAIVDFMFMVYVLFKKGFDLSNLQYDKLTDDLDSKKFLTNIKSIDVYNFLTSEISNGDFKQEQPKVIAVISDGEFDDLLSQIIAKEIYGENITFVVQHGKELSEKTQNLYRTHINNEIQFMHDEQSINDGNFLKNKDLETKLEIINGYITDPNLSIHKMLAAVSKITVSGLKEI